MSFFEDIFDSNSTAGKATFILAIFLILWLLVTGGVAGLLLFRITHPEVRGVGVRAEDLPSKPEVVPFRVPGGNEDREGWFFPGVTTSPTVILCHGYQTYRGDLITLVSSLQKDRFNVFVFDFSGHGKSGGSTSLGSKEAGELLAAVDAVLQRVDVDRTRVGVWGYDIGGYAVVAAASADKRIQAIAVDSIYERPADFFAFQARNSALAKLPLTAPAARWGFTLMHWGARNDPPVSDRVGGLGAIPKFFIQGRDNPALADSTFQIFLRAPEIRKQSVMNKSNYAAMQEEERKGYETEVVQFFIAAFPPLIVQ